MAGANSAENVLRKIEIHAAPIGFFWVLEKGIRALPRRDNGQNTTEAMRVRVQEADVLVNVLQPDARGIAQTGVSMKSDKKEKPFKPLKLRDSQGAVSNPLAAICRKFTHKRIETGKK